MPPRTGWTLHRISTERVEDSIRRLGRSFIIAKVLKPIIEVVVVFTWLIYLAWVVTHQSYDLNLSFDLFLAREGGPTASHSTTYLIFLSIFPLAYLVLRSIIPAFLIEVTAFEIHEGLWQVPYYIAWHSVISLNVWLAENIADTATAAVAIAALMLVYHLPARFFAVLGAAWGIFLAAWLALGFPVTVLTKIPNVQAIPSIYNTVLWVNQIEFLGWVYFTAVLLVCLLLSVRSAERRPKADHAPRRPRDHRWRLAESRPATKQEAGHPAYRVA